MRVSHNQHAARATSKLDASKPPVAGTVPNKRIVLLSFFNDKNDYYPNSKLTQLDRLIAAAKHAHLPPGTPVYLGSYGVSAKDADEIHKAGFKYAPILVPQRLEHPTRKLSAADEAKVRAHETPPGKFAGQVPMLCREYETGKFTTKHGKRVPVLTTDPAKAAKDASGHPKVAIDPATGKPSVDMPPAEQLAWGREMGRRMRDELRGKNADSFQMDEIWPSTAGAGKGSRATMRYMTGVLEGVRNGRPELGDKPMKGIIHVAGLERYTHLNPHDPEAHAFFTALNAAATRVSAEEYPSFRGGAAAGHAEAKRNIDTIRELKKFGAAGQGVLSKLMVTMSPGEKGGDLHGRAPGESLAQVKAYREAYEKEVLALGAHGLCEYSWLPRDGHGLNQRQETMNEVLREISQALR